MPKKRKVTKISATDLQRLSAKIIRRAYNGEHFIVDRSGYPTVAIMSVHEYETLIKQCKKI